MKTAWKVWKKKNPQSSELKASINSLENNGLSAYQLSWDIVKTTLDKKIIILIFNNQELKENIQLEKLFGGWQNQHESSSRKEIIKKSFEKRIQGTSLVLQWLRISSPSAEVPGSIPGQRTRSHMVRLKPGEAK